MKSLGNHALIQDSTVSRAHLSRLGATDASMYSFLIRSSLGGPSLLTTAAGYYASSLCSCAHPSRKVTTLLQMCMCHAGARQCPFSPRTVHDWPDQMHSQLARYRLKNMCSRGFRMTCDMEAEEKLTALCRVLQTCVRACIDTDDP
jgi:hypothetical protein